MGTARAALGPAVPLREPLIHGNVVVDVDVDVDLDLDRVEDQDQVQTKSRFDPVTT
jgi:hypothetical protein